MSLDKPNLILPLALTFNERAIAGWTESVNNARDQQKTNFYNEVAKNPLTNKGTLTLSKRPGAALDAQTYGNVSQAAYLVVQDITAPSLNEPWVVATTTLQSSQAVFAASNTATGSIFIESASAGVVYHYPAFIDTTNLSGVDNVVLQSRATSAQAAQRIHFTTSLAGWTEIIDGDFTSLNHVGKMEHMDGYAFIMTSNGRVHNSDLNSLANWTSTNYVTKQNVQDNSHGLAKLNNQILAFGEESVEIFYNSGNASGSPLTRIPQLAERIGLASLEAWLTASTKATSYYTTLHDRIYFLGRKKGGRTSISLFSYDGSRFEKVSTPYVDKMLSERVSDITSVGAVGFNGQYAISIETTPNSTCRWLMFFPDWKDWFIWTSTRFRPVNNGRFFLSCVTGGATTGQHRLFSMESSNIWADAGTTYSAEAAFKLPTNGYNLKRIPMWGFEADTDTSANSLTVRYSDDNTSSYAAFGTIDLTLQKKVKYRGGAFRERHIQLVSNNARPVRLHNFVAKIL